MDKLFNKDGSYAYMSFKGSSGVWRLIGSEVKGTIKQTIDTFKGETGELRDYERQQVMEQANLGNITPIETSKITYNTSVRKR